jgi:hypothetical protein
VRHVFIWLSSIAVLSCGGSTSQSVQDAGTDTSALPATNSALAQLCVDTINMHRASMNLPPYGRLGVIETCADSQAKSDALASKDHGAFGACAESAQNECPNWPGPPEAMIKNCLGMMWAEGPGTDFAKHGHYLNMSSTTYKKVACGFYKTESGGWWSVQDFR